MINTTITELKRNLNQVLQVVGRGESVVVTRRGSPVARIIPESSMTLTRDDKLTNMAARGLIHLPTKELNRNFPDPIFTGGSSVADMVIEDRR